MKKKLGILGGMGPAASAEFIVRLIEQTPASKDQDHIPFVLWSDPRVPDRSTSMRNGDNDPLPYLLEGIKGLKAAGCDTIVIPCNTAHFWFHELEKHAHIIHIVDSVADALRGINITGTIGVIGTQATIGLGLYQHHLNKLGWDCIVPTKEEMDTKVQLAIDLIKGGKIIESQPLLIEVMYTLIDRGAKAIVLGCTELPLAIRILEEKGVPIVNSIDSLVHSAMNNINNQPFNN